MTYKNYTFCGLLNHPSSERSGYQPPKVDEIDPYFFKDPFWIRGTALKRILK